MKKGWKVREFKDSLQKIKGTKKIPKKSFLAEGKYPIVSQEYDYINGYWNDSEDLLKVEKPIVVFGDHTKIVKYIDFDFVKGADGIVILLPIEEINSKFFAYQLQNIKLRDLGYARHYRLLKEEEIVFPELNEQKAIVAKLDKAFKAIAQARANVEQNIANAEELKNSRINSLFEEINEGVKLFLISNVCNDIFAGGDKPKPNFSKIKTDEFKVPVVSNSEKNHGLFGYTDKARVFQKSITITARGSIGYIEKRDYSYFPIVRLIVIIPNLEKIIHGYFYYALKNLDILNTGSSIPQLTVPMIKKSKIYLPSFEIQKDITNKAEKIEIKAKRIIEKYQQKLESLEELKQSILEKAFKGELV